MKKTSITLIAILTLCIMMSSVLTGCSSIDCNLNGQVMCHYAIQSQAGQEDIITVPMTVTLMPEVQGEDSVYINKMRNAKVFDLPMSHTADADRIAITLDIDEDTKLSDTITVWKSNDAWFESVDCSPHYNHTIQRITSTHHFIDTLIISNPKVSNDPAVQNISIRMSRSY